MRSRSSESKQCTSTSGNCLLDVLRYRECAGYGDSQHLHRLRTYDSRLHGFKLKMSKNVQGRGFAPIHGFRMCQSFLPHSIDILLYTIFYCQSPPPYTIQADPTRPDPTRPGPTRPDPVRCDPTQVLEILNQVKTTNSQQSLSWHANNTRTREIKYNLTLEGQTGSFFTPGTL